MANNNNFKCPKCGQVFPNPIQFSGSTEVYVDYSAVQCPRCGTMFKPPAISGSFDEEGNIIGLRDYLTNQLRPEDLVSLRALAQQAQANPEVRQNFAQEANKIAPGLGYRLNSYLGDNQYTVAFLSFLLTLLGTLLTAYGLFKTDSPTPTINNNTYNYYGEGGRPKIEQVGKPRPGKLGSNITLPKKPRKKRGKRT